MTRLNPYFDFAGGMVVHVKQFFPMSATKSNRPSLIIQTMPSSQRQFARRILRPSLACQLPPPAG